MSGARYPITVEGDTALIGSAAELVVALDVLQGHHDTMVLRQLSPHLPEVLAGPEGLYAALRALSPDDQLVLIDALGPRLVDVVQSAPALRDILATLAEGRVEERVVSTLGGEGLRTLIGLPEELAEVLEWVYGVCDRLVLDLLGVEYLKGLFQSGYELSLVLHALNPVRQGELVELLGWGHVSSLVRNRRDLAHLLRALPSDLSSRLLDPLTGAQLRALIRNDRDWRYLHQTLEVREAAYLEDRLEAHDAE
jgi:hypothetical protein